MDEEESAKPTVVPDDAGQSPLKNLSILPPLQKKGTLSWNEMADAISLPPIRAEEPVSSLRGALGEVCGYAHLTSFRLVLEEGKTKTKSRTAPIISPYTGADAVVSIPISVKSLDTNGDLVQSGDVSVTLDDYGDLTALLEKGLKDGSSFRIVLERYDSASVRDHITRVRYLLDGNAPYVATLAEEETLEQEKDEPEKEPEDRAAKKQAEQDERKLTELPNERPIALDGSNLKDFYYLACGEEDGLYEQDEHRVETDLTDPSKNSKKNKGKKKDNDTNHADELSDEKSSGKSMKEIVTHLNELEEKTRVNCSIRFSGFHPPPRFRRLMGDLCYLEVTILGEPIFNITAVPTGFYVNRSSIVNCSYKFDPSPAAKHFFSHELLDCLLQASDSFRSSWEAALNASKDRAEQTAATNRDKPLYSLQRVAVRGNYGGFQDAFAVTASQGIDSIVLRPSWLVPMPLEAKGEDAWNHNAFHKYNPARMEDELSSSFGLDIRNGAARDWNEELQGSREMPVSSPQERLERARMIHKVMNDFGEASVVGAMAIFDGNVAPMNPNEPTRSHVYLHNNIFFSRAIDSGVETFKIATGDACARKSASRDAQCMGALYRLDVPGLYTLATVLVDYLGTRFICQSIVPGILHGEKTHTLLYGAVEATSPLSWDKDMHELLESSIGRTFMIASRPIPTRPLTDERIAEVERRRSQLPFLPATERSKEDEAELPATRTVCGPIEAKGIQGSDQRKYLLDLTRLTPRDANWVPKSKGGTGRWERVLEENGTSDKKHLIPETLDDDELIMAILRPELVTLLTHKKMSEYMQGKKQEEEKKEKAGNETHEQKFSSQEDMEVGKGSLSDEAAVKVEGDSKDAKPEPKKRTLTPEDEEHLKSKNEKAGNETHEQKFPSQEDVEVGKGSLSDKAAVKVEGDSKDAKPEPKKRTLTPEDEEHLKSMRLNVNLFLPYIKSQRDVDHFTLEQLEDDMKRVRELSSILWDVLLPRLTQEIREGTNQQLPNDGRSLTELLHQRGINCRYLGRLACLAAAEEEMDKAAVAAMKRGHRIPRRVMPLCWLEMLECEMVARSAKHVLDSYLTEHGGTGATQPAQIIVSFLSALLSTSEESAGETEIRLRKEASAAFVSMPDEDDFRALAIIDTGGGGDAVPAPIRCRKEVWDDIERDIGRRFRYSLSFYNQPGANSRALYVPLLRRVCQRTGVRLVAKNYTLGEKCLSNAGSASGGRITASYPFSVLDILEVVPLVKHSAAHGGEGFVPCSPGPNIILPPLHVLLPDAKSVLDSATLHYQARALPLALELAQEAANLYQRAVDSPMHSSILRCLDLSTAILFDAGETELAVSNASRSLALSVQLGGFDNAESVACHSTMMHVLINSGKMAAGVKHMRAALYLMELMAGPRFAELSTMYHKLGTIYHSVQNPTTALRCYQEASSRCSSDRLVEGMVAKSTALVLGNFGHFKAAVELEKRAYQLYAALLGENHDLTKNSHTTLENLTRLAVEQGSQQVAESKKRQEEEAAKVITQREEEAANAIASQIEVEEEEEEKKRKKNKKKAKKKK